MESRPKHFNAVTCKALYLEVTVENPAENTTVRIVWNRLENPAARFVLASVDAKEKRYITTNLNTDLCSVNALHAD